MTVAPHCVKGRRELLRALGLLTLSSLAPEASSLTSEYFAPPVALLNAEQSACFRAWITFIVAQQYQRGPSPRWFHRDCAGLARYAVSETLRLHDARWRQANGLEGERLPSELRLHDTQSKELTHWVGLDGSRQSFVTAQAMIHRNSQPIGKAPAVARPGDLLFFDQGDDQHLMIWMGRWIAYHNGQTPVAAHRPRNERRSAGPAHANEDNGLRAVTLAELMQWKDTRWRPRDDNPNFAGFYRLAFLSR